MHPAEKNKALTCIIGGGASGLAAACVLTQAGLPFVLLEKENRLGRKLLATGNGRCNLMNVSDPVFFGDDGFAREVLAACPVAAVSDFFERIGLAWFVEEQSRAYPLSRQAATVLDSLMSVIAQAPDGRVLTDCRVNALEPGARGFEVRTAAGDSLTAARVIACPGSPAAPRLGGGDSLMPLLTRLGHRLVPFTPALCALMTRPAPLKGLSGLRFPAVLSLMVSGRLAEAAAGEALITDTGVSGLCAMQLARVAGLALREGKPVSLAVDCSPMLGLQEVRYRRLSLKEAGSRQDSLKAVEALLERRARRAPGRDPLIGLVPRQLARKMAGWPIGRAAQWLSGLELDVIGVRGFDQAQVAAGGIDCRDINPKTLASLRVPGLHICGEALNVDGDTGGFNLLFAWATGILAAGQVARELGG